MPRGFKIEAIAIDLDKKPNGEDTGLSVEEMQSIIIQALFENEIGFVTIDVTETEY